MSKTNKTKLAEKAIDTKNTTTHVQLHLVELERLVENGKRLDEIADFAYDITQPRLETVKGNLLALRILLDSGCCRNSETATAVGSIVSSLFTVLDDLQYDSELLAELHLDELAERHQADKDKVLR